MSKLWKEKTRFKSVDEEWGNVTEILPYERLYETLTPEELQELIQDAKRFHWQALDLHKCGLETLPPELGALTALRFLALGNENWLNDKFENAKKNVLSVLPDFVENLSNLQCLDLDNTPIIALPDFIGNLSNLQRLYLRNTQIAALPDSFGNLSNLQRLYLLNTQIIALPDSFGNLSNLQRLYLRNIQITALPNLIGNLHNLRQLALSNTPITSLPDSIGNLSNLQRLYLENTRIIALPDSFGNLSNLKRLSLWGTPLYEKLPPEIQRRLPDEPQEAIRYILETQFAAPKRYFNETKMVVVGQGSVGKSCLINRLIHGEYENQHSTEGIDIEPWNFSGQEVGLNNQETYRLNVWDFGGQEIYHATHQCQSRVEITEKECGGNSPKDMN